MSLQETKDHLIQLLADPDNKVIALSGKWGTGKSHLWREVQAASAERNCLAQQWVRFALGAAAMEAPASECATELQQLTSRVRSMPELLVRLTEADAFRYRAPSQ